LQKIDSFNSEELLDFVISQCSDIDMYLSAAATISVSILLQFIFSIVRVKLLMLCFEL